MDSQMHLEKGKSCWIRDLWNDAENFFNQALESDSNNSEAHYLLGIALERREDFNRALFHFKNAVLLNAKVKYLYNYAKILFEDFHQFDLALEQTTKSLKLEPENIEILTLHSKILHAKGLADAAGDCYEKTLTIKSKKSIRNTALLFRYEEINRYSYAALLGLIWADEELKNIDAFLSSNLINDLLIKLSQYSKIIVAISAFSSQMPSVAIDIIKIKKMFKNITIIAGGPHPTALPEDVLSLGADFVVIGGAEVTFPVLIHSILNDEPYENIPGIAFKKNNQIIKNKTIPISLNHYQPYHPKFKNQVQEYIFPH